MKLPDPVFVEFDLEPGAGRALDTYPSAPTDPAERRAWLERRTAGFARLNAPPDGVTWGGGKDPKAPAKPKR